MVVDRIVGFLSDTVAELEGVQSWFWFSAIDIAAESAHTGAGSLVELLKDAAVFGSRDSLYLNGPCQWFRWQAEARVKLINVVAGVYRKGRSENYRLND